MRLVCRRHHHAETVFRICVTTSTWNVESLTLVLCLSRGSTVTIQLVFFVSVDQDSLKQEEDDQAILLS